MDVPECMCVCVFSAFSGQPDCLLKTNPQRGPFGPASFLGSQDAEGQVHHSIPPVLSHPPVGLSSGQLLPALPGLGRWLPEDSR